MTRFLLLASCLLVPAFAVATGPARYRIDLRNGKQFLSRDLPVQRGSILTFHRDEDDTLTGVPSVFVLAAAGCCAPPTADEQAGVDLEAEASLSALSDTSTSLATIYANCAATSRGNGSVTHPYWRITDALNRARRLRDEDNRRIVIRVAPGICSGNFEPQPNGQDTRPPELLPLVLNVPDLTLHGAGIMQYAEGYPVAQRAGTATTVTVDVERLGILDNTVIYVGPTTDGGRADGTVIEGMAIDDKSNSWYGIFITRTQRITVRANVVEHVNFGAVNADESSGSIVGNVIHDGSPGVLVAGGTECSPSRLYVGSNSVTANFEGLGVFANSLATEHLDMGANPLEVLPYPINPTASQVGNHVSVEFEGNDVSNNNGGGLTFLMLGGSRYPYSQSGSINAHVHDNRFRDNGGYPLSIHQGFVFRSTSNYWTNPDPNDFPEGFLGYLAAPFITHGSIEGPYSGIVTASFEHNVWSNVSVTPIAPAILTFSYVDVYDPATGAPDPDLILHYTYMRNSRLNLTDEDGIFSLPGVIRDDLRAFDPLDGTALQNRTHITH